MEESKVFIVKDSLLSSLPPTKEEIKGSFWGEWFDDCDEVYDVEDDKLYDLVTDKCADEVIKEFEEFLSRGFIHHSGRYDHDEFGTAMYEYFLNWAEKDENENSIKELVSVETNASDCDGTDYWIYTQSYIANLFNKEV